ncbi:MAG: EamA family transporter [Clostridia bacterium]|nr:EamA family transporter [Clostridia bacterium]
MNRYLPILIVVISNTLYHICAKSVPEGLNTFASLTVTYLIAAMLSLAFFFVSQRNGNLLAEYRQLNWASFALGLAIIGLEAGFIMMYKVGWNISVGQLIASALLAIVLIFVGYLAYHEAITPTKLIGAAVCLVGLYLLNK